MKKVIFLMSIFLISINVNSQNWTIESVDDAFSGKLQFASAEGSNGSFPYNKPRIAFRKDKDNNIDGFITGAGSMACDNQKFTFAFNGKFEDRLVINIVPSTDNDTGYFSDINVENLYQLVEKLKSSSFVEVLLETDCSNNRFKFNLSGSTEALNSVVGDYYKKKIDNKTNAKELIYPDYLIWKESIDNDIKTIYSEYKIQDYYGITDYSFDDFQKLVYDELMHPSDDLLEYFQSWIGDKYKEVSFIIGLHVKKDFLDKYELLRRTEKFDTNSFFVPDKKVLLTPKD